MCLIPRQVLERDRPVAAALHQVGRLRVRPARQGGRLPDGDLPGRRGLARAVDRQERRPGLAGLLPPPQPLRRGAAALAVRARRPDGAREPQPPDQAPGLACSTPPSSCGHLALRGRARRARRACTASCPPSWRRSTRSASSSPTPSCRPTPTPSRRCAARSRRARARTTPEIPGRKATLLAAGLGAAAPAAAGPRDCRGATRRPRSPRMDAKWFRLAQLRLGVVSMNDGTSVALYKRDPRAVPRPAASARSRSTSGFHREWPRLAAAVPRRARRDHLARGVGEDLRALDRRRRTAPTETPRRSGEPTERPPVSTTASGPRGPPRPSCEALPLAPPAATGLGEVVRRRYLLQHAGAQRHPVALPGHGAGLAVALPAAGHPVLHVLLPVPGHGRPRRQHGELRHPPVRRHGRRPLLHRDLQRRHPLDRAEQRR